MPSLLLIQGTRNQASSVMVLTSFSEGHQGVHQKCLQRYFRLWPIWSILCPCKKPVTRNIDSKYWLLPCPLYDWRPPRHLIIKCWFIGKIWILMCEVTKQQSGYLCINSLLINTSHEIGYILYVDGLVQERHNSSALTMELPLSCTNP